MFRDRQAPTILELACVAAATLAAAAPARAQQLRYRAQSDTLYYREVNPYRLYWVTRADTVGIPQHEVRVQSQLWSAAGAALAVRAETQGLDVNRYHAVRRYIVAPSGNVVSEVDSAPKPGSRTTFGIPLPDRPLVVGLRWSDTMTTGPGKDSVGEQLSDATRDFEVTRVFDTLGTRAAELKAHGTWRFRMTMWADSARTRVAWMDVRGPMEEHDFVDAARGRTIRESWTMDLRGRGVPVSGRDTVAAGLRSSETTDLVPPAVARFLMQPLPGADTAVTLDPTQRAAILLHTVARPPGSAVEAMVRNDGMVGVARLTLDSAGPARFTATWADSDARLVERTVVREGGVLRATGTGLRDTTLVPPAATWSIADYAMLSLLGPTVLTLPRDGSARPFAIYRPYPGHWDTGLVSATERAGMVIVAYTPNDGAPEYLVFTPAGDYLYGENSEPTGSARVPVNASRRQQLQTFLATIKGGR